MALTLEQKELVMRDLVIKPLENTFKGGQSASIPIRAITLKSSVIDVEFTIGCCRSQHKNKEIALTLLELILDSI